MQILYFFFCHVIFFPSARFTKNVAFLPSSREFWKWQCILSHLEIKNKIFFSDCMLFKLSTKPLNYLKKDAMKYIFFIIHCMLLYSDNMCPFPKEMLSLRDHCNVFGYPCSCIVLSMRDHCSNKTIFIIKVLNHNIF